MSPETLVDDGPKVDSDDPRVLARQELRAAASVLIERLQWANAAGITFSGSRDLYSIFGYDRKITTQQYRERYARGGIAKRIVEAMPKATWRGSLELIEDEKRKTETEFEKAWIELDKRLHVTATLQRVDILAGLSTYAVLLIGAPGELYEELKKGRPDDLVYLTPFAGGGSYTSAASSFRIAQPDASADCIISDFDYDVRSPRFGLPLYYQLRRIDISNPEFTRKVHWSRILHVAEGVLENDVYGQPALEVCWNLLDDLDKVTGGGAEAFFQRANQGMNLNIQKDAKFSPEDLIKLKEEAEEYRHGSRILKTREMDVNMLGSDVANFSQPADAILTQIAGAKSIPKRILTGSEMGELASSQDRDNWKDQINGRQTGYAGPFIVRPLVDRLIKYGYLPTPKQYEPRWAHIQTLTDQEKAEGAKSWAESLTAEGPVFLRDEIRDRWYGMEPLPKPKVDDDGVHTAPESGLELDPKIDPKTGLPIKIAIPTMGTDPDTGLPVTVDPEVGLPAHQTADMTPFQKAQAAKKAKKDAAKAKLKAAEDVANNGDLADPDLSITSEEELVQVLAAAITVGESTVIDRILGTALRDLGGAGSGNYAHEGRPGMVGGSALSGMPSMDTRVWSSTFDPKKIRTMVREDRLTPAQMTKLHAALAGVDAALKDPEIGGAVWQALSAFSPQSLSDKVEAMQTGLHGSSYVSPTAWGKWPFNNPISKTSFK